MTHSSLISSLASRPALSLSTAARDRVRSAALPSLESIQAKLPPGYYAENRHGILAIFYPATHPAEAARVMCAAGAHGWSRGVSGPCFEFPEHSL